MMCSRSFLGVSSVMLSVLLVALLGPCSTNGRYVSSQYGCHLHDLGCRDKPGRNDVEICWHLVQCLSSPTSNMINFITGNVFASAGERAADAFRTTIEVALPAGHDTGMGNFRYDGTQAETTDFLQTVLPCLSLQYSLPQFNVAALYYRWKR